MMRNKELNIDWDFFKTKFEGMETSKFEQMAYLLFASETGNPNGIFRYKNHPGIETDPVVFNGKVSGFQAKFLTSFADGKDDIIDSLTKAKVNHPNLEDIYIYTNNEPGMAYEKNTGKKPGYMTDIENKASELGMNVVWRLPSHIEAQLALSQNRYIYEIFFGDENSNYALSLAIDKHSDSLLAPIHENVVFHGESIHINRDTISSHLVDQFTSGAVLMVSGEGGSGKTALIKEIYKKQFTKFPIVIFKASELNRDSLNDIFKLDRNFTFSQFIETFSTDPQKVFVVDSAERLAEFDDVDLIAGMFRTLLKGNWTLLFLTRTVYQNSLSTFMADGFDIKPNLINIPNLQESELQQLALNKGFSLPDNPRFVSRLSNLFYLGEYLKNYDDIDRKGNYRDFTDKLWHKKICGSLHKNEMHVLRDRCMIEIAKRRADSGCFYIDTADLRQEALFTLRQDEILGFDVSRNEYFISHDIYEEWALNKIVDRSWKKTGEMPAFLSAIGDSLPIRRAFRMWLSDELMECDTIPQIIPDAFNDSSLSDFWKDEIIVACLLSNHADKFFSLFDKEIKANNFAIFWRVLFLLRTACVTLNRFLPQLMVPCGKGWEETIHFMYKHSNETFEKNAEIALPVLRDWTSANPSGQATKESGEMVFSVIENAVVSKAYISANIAKELISISLKSVKEIPQRITAFINKIIASSNARRPYVMRLFVEEILTNPIMHLLVCQELPMEVIALCEKCWTYEPPVSNELTNHSGPFISDYISRENKLGLSNESEHHYFPPSAYQTPILFLLRKKPIETLDFIIRFINKFIENYKECDYDTCVEEVTLKIEGEEYHQCCSPGLWECYRGMGTPVLPYLIQSVHMALEKFLMEILDSFEADKVKWILKKILTESKSASLTAVVTSVVLKNYLKLPDIAMMIFSTPEFIDFDLRRCIRERSARDLTAMSTGMSGFNNGLYAKERTDACNEKHRSISIENIVHAYQYCHIPGFSEKEQQEYICKIHNLIDFFKSDKKLMVRMSAVLERIDRRNLKMETEPVEGGFMLKFIPKTHSQQTIEGQKEADRQYEQIMKYSALKLWPSKYLNENREKIQKISEYDNAPEKVIADLRLLMADTESLTGETSLINKGIPEAVASKLLRESADKLSDEDRLFCKEIIMTGLQNMFREDYWYQVGDGSEDSVMALPAIMELYPEDADDCVVILALSMVRFRNGGGWTNLSKFAPAAVRNSHLWEKNPEKAEVVLAYFISMQKLAYTETENFYAAFEQMDARKTTIDVSDIDCTQVPDLNAILSLLPYNTQDSRLMTIYEKICAELPGRFFNDYRRSSDPEENPYNDTAFIDARFNVFDNISLFILSRSDANEIKRYLNPLMRKFACSDHMAYFINSLIYKENELQRIPQFEAVWEMLYPKILEFKDEHHLHHRDEIFCNFFFCSRIWNENIHDWHSLTPSIIRVFDKAAKDMSGIPSIIFCMGKFFSGLGSKYIDNGLNCVYEATHNAPQMKSENFSDAAIFYLERFMNQYRIQRSRKIREDRNIKRKVISILNFMISHGSAKAFRLRDLL